MIILLIIRIRGITIIRILTVNIIRIIKLIIITDDEDEDDGIQNTALREKIRKPNNSIFLNAATF
jgi:hypothetical protein